jgi:hypothetical protein
MPSSSPSEWMEDIASESTVNFEAKVHQSEPTITTSQEDPTKNVPPCRNRGLYITPAYPTTINHGELKPDEIGRYLPEEDTSTYPQFLKDLDEKQKPWPPPWTFFVIPAEDQKIRMRLTEETLIPDALVAPRVTVVIEDPSNPGYDYSEIEAPKDVVNNADEAKQAIYGLLQTHAFIPPSKPEQTVDEMVYRFGESLMDSSSHVPESKSRHKQDEKLQTPSIPQFAPPRAARSRSSYPYPYPPGLEPTFHSRNNNKHRAQQAQAAADQVYQNQSQQFGHERKEVYPAMPPPQIPKTRRHRSWDPTHRRPPPYHLHVEIEERSKGQAEVPAVLIFRNESDQFGWDGIRQNTRAIRSISTDASRRYSHPVSVPPDTSHQREKVKETWRHMAEADAGQVQKDSGNLTNLKRKASQNNQTTPTPQSTVVPAAQGKETVSAQGQNPRAHIDYYKEIPEPAAIWGESVNFRNEPGPRFPYPSWTRDPVPESTGPRTVPRPSTSVPAETSKPPWRSMETEPENAAGPADEAENSTRPNPPSVEAPNEETNPTN